MHGINILHNYHLFHWSNANKLLGTLVFGNYSPYRTTEKYVSQSEASDGICLKRKSVFEKASLCDKKERKNCVYFDPNKNSTVFVLFLCYYSVYQIKSITRDSCGCLYLGYLVAAAKTRITQSLTNFSR